MVRSKSAKRFERLAHTVMILVTICIVLPFILLFMSSITSESALVRDGYSFFPKEFSIHAYKFIWDNAANVFRAYGITILVTVIGTSINVAMSALLAYPLSLKNLPGKRILNFYIFFTMLFNGGLVPTYLMYTGIFHINNTLLAYIVPGLLMSAMNVMLIRTFFATSIPDALFEAAQIDGCSPMGIFFKIVLPLSKAALASIGLMFAVSFWNDYTNFKLYITKNKLFNFQIQLRNMVIDSDIPVDDAVNQETIGNAATIIAILPFMIIYPFCQKYFVQGVNVGAVKE